MIKRKFIFGDSMKLRDLINEAKSINIDDLDIDKHGVRNTLYVPTTTDTESGFYTNKPGYKGLEDWKTEMKNKYGIKTVSVDKGTVTITNAKFKKDKDKFISGKATTLKGWKPTQ